MFNKNHLLNKPIAFASLIWAIVVLFLLIGNVYFGIQCNALQKDLQEAKTALESQKIKGQVLDFTQLFIAEVLKAEQEIDFETRLKLENAVRNLGDEDILTQWNKFVESETENNAQQEVKNLLELLVNKIK